MLIWYEIHFMLLLYVCYLDSIILDPRPLFKKPIISKKSFRCLIDKIYLEKKLHSSHVETGPGSHV